MKHFLFVLVVLCTFCSCAKNYPELVKKRVQQYKQEGKIILSQSNDEMGKEHYIVFGDPKNNAIGIDTIGEKVKCIRLSKKKNVRITPYVYEDGKGLRFFQEDMATSNISFSDGKFEVFYGDVSKPMKVTAYKDKYVLLEAEGDMPVLLFFNKPNVYYSVSGTPTVVQNGNIEIAFEEYAKFVFFPDTNYMANFMYGGNPPFLTNEYENFSYQITLSPNSMIIKRAGKGYLGNVEIPDEAFSHSSMLLPYIQEAKERGWQGELIKQAYGGY